MRNKNRIFCKIWILVFIISTCFSLSFAEGEVPIEEEETTSGEAVLNPGFIAGTISTGISNISRVFIRAKSTDFETYLYKYDGEGNYQLTVNVPQGETMEYNMFYNANINYQYQNSHVYSDGYKDFMQFKPVSTIVSEGQTSTVNFIVESGFIFGKVTLSSSSVSIVEGQASTIYAVINDGVNFSYAWTRVASDGTFYFPIQPNESIKINGSVVLSNGETCTLEDKYLNVFPNLETEVNWYIELTGTVCGAIDNNITINSEDIKDYHYTYLYTPGGALYKTVKHDGYYLFDKLIPGNWRLRMFSYLNNYDDTIYHPYASYPYPVEVFGGETVDCDVDMYPARINGTLLLSGTKSIEDISSATIAADGIYNSDSYGGQSYDRVNKEGGLFDLIVHPGSYNIYRTNIYFNDSEPYLNCSLHVYDYAARKDVFTVAEGEVLDNVNINYATGSATIKFSRTDGGAFTSPYIRGTCRNYDENSVQKEYMYIYAHNYSQGADTASFVGLPGTYEVDTYAKVDGAQTEFGKVIITIEAGTEKVIDIDGPTLSILEPEAELYTNQSLLDINGQATDDVGVESVTVNGVDSALISTENPNDLNEVAFSSSFELSLGKNAIETIALDAADKSSSDKRYVYYDPNPPILTWTPNDGEVINGFQVKVEGTATDETEVKEVFINGKSVEITKTNNPEDPNEVAYSALIDLAFGNNSAVVKAVDVCSNEAQETRIVVCSKIIDVTAPVITAPADITEEQTSASGNLVSLGNPSVTDNIDPNPAIINNAASIFPQGATIVTWTATDSSGNSTSATQTVIIKDTTAPVLKVPGNITIEQTSPDGMKASPGQASATDVVDPAPQITNNAPSIFPQGTTIITWTATDSSGNSVSANQTVTVQDTKAPGITAPQDLTVEQESFNGNKVTLENPIVKDAVDLSPVVSNNAPAIFPQGTTIVTWSATDKSGNTATASQKVIVKDTSAPDLTIPENITMNTKELEGIGISLGDATASDIADPSPSISNDAPSVFKIGVTEILWVAVDASGNKASKVQSVTIEEVIEEEAEIPEEPKPIEFSLTLDDDILWPPNHKYRTIKVVIKADAQILPLVKLVSVTSDELEDDKESKKGKNTGDGNTLNDMVVIDNTTVDLRAERSGDGDGRVYTLNYEAVDGNGNIIKQSIQLSVPHDLGKKDAIDSGVKYVVSA